MNTISSKEKPDETKTITSFIDFINQKKNKKVQKQDIPVREEEIQEKEATNLKITYINNPTEKPSVAPKVDQSQNDGSLKSLLSQMSGRVVNSQIELPQVQKEEEPSESESESEEEEKDSDLLSEEDYEEEKYNHFVRPILQYTQQEEEIESQEEPEKEEIEENEHQSKKERRKVECEVFAENIPLYKNEKETVKFFKGLNNNIVKIKVLKNKEDGTYRGKAFIKFFSKEEAESFLKYKLKFDKNAITLTIVKKFGGEGEERPNKKQNKFNKNENQYQEKNYNQNKFANKYNATEESSIQNTLNTAFIRNLPETLDEDTIRKNFKQFGKIANVRLMKNGEGKSKGFGYVDFVSSASLTSAVTSQEKVTINDKQIFIEKAKSSFSLAVHEDGKRLGKKKRREYN